VGADLPPVLRSAPPWTACLINPARKLIALSAAPALARVVRWSAGQHHRQIGSRALASPLPGLLRNGAGQLREEKVRG
jgi:hypothetical protein